MPNQEAPKSEPRPSMVAGETFGLRVNSLPKAVAEEPTVTMMFPEDVSLNLDDYAGQIHFKAGINEVPRSLADHAYLKNHGVKIYRKGRSEADEAEETARRKKAG